MIRTRIHKKLSWGRGQRREFSDEQLDQVELLAKLGATDKQLALFFGVATVTIDLWMKNYDDFREARKKGGMEADMKVAEALYRRAVGYSYIEEEYTAVTDPDTGERIPMNQMVMVKKVKKQVVPDVKAQLAWLKSRQRETWGYNPEVNHVITGKVEHLHRKLQEIPVDELTPQAQTLLFEIANKQLMAGPRDN